MRRGWMTREHYLDLVAATNLISQPAPVYPPLAKEARIQGTVRFDATIGTDGHILNLGLVDLAKCEITGDEPQIDRELSSRQMQFVEPARQHLIDFYRAPVITVPARYRKLIVRGHRTEIETQVRSALERDGIDLVVRQTIGHRELRELTIAKTP